MIKSFRCKDTQILFEGRTPRRFRGIEQPATRKLQMLDDATDLLSDLGGIPGNRKGQWSIRINDQWRICFQWLDGGASNVEIVDYH
ncbi:MAG TPA: type II toxin-antitoxin system RelE/ParE family toxin [Gammaproteobacteria bacterium]|nr:type II toxin-antitoxin system RelE/ParE family toxin [Gammaproteobacteria bacterium]